MTDWEHKPTPGQPAGLLIGGALCLFGGGSGLVILIPDEGWSGTSWLFAGVVLLGAALLTVGALGIHRLRRNSTGDR